MGGTCTRLNVLEWLVHAVTNLFQDGEIWQVDDCTVCECEATTTHCYKQYCPHCPQGTEMVKLPGECCGRCEKGECSDFIGGMINRDFSAIFTPKQTFEIDFCQPFSYLMAAFEL